MTAREVEELYGDPNAPTPKGTEMADLSTREPGWFKALHPSRWRHRKRGTSYEVLTSTADAQCATGPINEGDHVTVYRGDDGDWHVRKTGEFQDGRFERTDLTEGWPNTPGEDRKREELLAALRDQETLFKHRLAAFVTEILHGDEGHKAWLWDAANAFLAGEPVPKPPVAAN